MQKKVTKSILSYQAIFEPCEEGGFTVIVPKLPGLITEGDTFEQAKVNAEDAIKGYLELLVEAKEVIPTPDIRAFSATIDVVVPFHPPFATA